MVSRSGRRELRHRRPQDTEVGRGAFQQLKGRRHRQRTSTRPLVGFIYEVSLGGNFLNLYIN